MNQRSKSHRASWLLLLLGLSMPLVGACVQPMTTDSPNQWQNWLIQQLEDGSGYQPDGGFVGDETTAIAIAVAIWNSIYGEESITRQKPFQAVLRDGLWLIAGSLEEGRLGGVAYAVIEQQSGRIRLITHTR